MTIVTVEVNKQMQCIERVGDRVTRQEKWEERSERKLGKERKRKVRGDREEGR